MSDALRKAFLEYDQAVLRFWHGSSEDIDSGADDDHRVTRLIKQLAAAGNNPRMKPRDWRVIVQPARDKLIAQIQSIEDDTVTAS